MNANGDQRLTLLDRTLVHRRYLPNNVGTHLQLSILRQMQHV